MNKNVLTQGNDVADFLMEEIGKEVIEEKNLGTVEVSDNLKRVRGEIKTVLRSKGAESKLEKTILNALERAQSLYDDFIAP